MKEYYTASLAFTLSNMHLPSYLLILHCDNARLDGNLAHIHVFRSHFDKCLYRTAAHKGDVLNSYQLRSLLFAYVKQSRKQKLICLPVLLLLVLICNHHIRNGNLTKKLIIHNDMQLCNGNEE